MKAILVKRSVGRAIGALVNALVVLYHTLLFGGAISALWGWYIASLVSCAVMLALAFDKEGYIRKVYRDPAGRIAMTKGERIVFYYFLILLVVAVAFNLIFVATHLLGIYIPPLGDIPRRY